MVETVYEVLSTWLQCACGLPVVGLTKVAVSLDPDTGGLSERIIMEQGDVAESRFEFGMVYEPLACDACGMHLMEGAMFCLGYDPDTDRFVSQRRHHHTKFRHPIGGGETSADEG